MRRLLALVPVVAALAAPSAASAQLPVVKIDVNRSIPDEPKIPATLRMPGYRGRIGIERRGQSSQRFFPMKSYAIELQRDARLLGMPEDDDWVLYAPYNDKSLMRNVLAYRTARGVFGRYAARTRFVRLRLNGRFHGIFVLMEKLELGKDRVRGEALYELTVPSQAKRKDPSFRTPIRNRPIVWEDPERGDLSKKRAIALARPVRRAERALYGSGGWTRRIDAASAADFALINELFKNQDAFERSTYMSLHADGRLRIGPVWDFDISMGNSYFGSSRVPGWLLESRDWAERMYDQRSFIERMGARWRGLRADGLRGRVMRMISANYRQLRGPARAHFRRWPVLNRLVWPNPAVRGSYRAEVRFLRSWLSRRMNWLDGRFLRG
jgi:hypothetical protein